MIIMEGFRAYENDVNNIANTQVPHHCEDQGLKYCQAKMKWQFSLVTRRLVYPLFTSQVASSSPQ